MQALTEQQFNDVVQRVIASAPAGLDEASFQSLLDAEVSKAEAGQMRPVSSHGDDDKLEQDFPGLRQKLSKIDQQRREAEPSANAAGMAMLAGPGILAPAAAAGVGRYVTDRFGGKSVGDAAGNATLEGASTAAFGGLVKLPEGLRRLSRRAIKGSLKVDRGYLEKMATARQQGLMGAEEEIVDTVLAQPGRRNVMTAAGTDRLQGRLDATDAARNAMIDAAPNVPKPGSGADQADAVRALVVDNMDATRSEGVSAARQVLDDLVNNPKYGAPMTSAQVVSGRKSAGNPRDLTPSEMRARIAADNAELRGMFGKEQAPAVEAVKAVRGVNSRNLDAVAGTGDLSQQMKRLIDLRNVTNIARRRGEARDVLGITDVVSMSAGRPEVLLATTAMRPAVQMQIGLVLDKVRRGIPLQGTAAERAAVQAIVKSLMATGHGQE